MSDNQISTQRLPVRPRTQESNSDKVRVETRPAIDPTIMAAIENETDGNKFYFDKSNQPVDMSYEFKRKTYGGMEDKPYQMELKRKGWVAVPSSRHPECGTEDPEGIAIVIGGQILMERHEAYTARSRELANVRNAQQVGGQFERLQLGGSEHMPRKVTTMKQTYEAGQDIPA